MGNKNSKNNRRKKASKKFTDKPAEVPEEVHQPAYCRRWSSRPLRRCQSDNRINYELLQQCGVHQSLYPPSQRPTLGPPPPFNPRPCLCAQNNQEVPQPIPCNCPRPISCNCPRPMPFNYEQQTQPQPKLMACCCVMPIPQTMTAPRSYSDPRPRSYSQPQPRQRSYSQPRERREVHFLPPDDQSTQLQCSQSSINLSIDYIPCPHYSNSHGRHNTNYSHRQYGSDTSLEENDSIPSCSSCCSNNNSDRSVNFADSRRSRRTCFRCFQKRKNRSPRYQ